MNQRQTMSDRFWQASSLLLCALLSACATTPQHSEQYLIYSEQMERNEDRLGTCSLGHAKQYQATGRFSDEKIVRGALKQCRAYTTNYCHAWVARDLLEEIPTEVPVDWHTSAKAACVAQVTEVKRAELLGWLTES